MSKIEIGRYAALLRRSLGMSGVENVASHLSPEVSPTWQLESADDQWAFLKDVKVMGVTEFVQAGVGAASFSRIRNPVNSGVIAIIKFLTAQPGAAAAMAVHVGPQTVDLTNTSLGAARDTRWPVSPTANQSAMRITFEFAGAAPTLGGGTLLRVLNVGNVPMEYPFDIILTPGFAVDWGGTTIDVAMNVMAVWQERNLPALEDGE